MAAGHARVLAEVAARTDKRYPVPEQHAGHRVPDQRPAVGLMDKAMAAVTGVLDASSAFGHAMHMVSEQPAQISDAFLEPALRGVRIRVHGKQQRVPALHARVFHVTVARSNRLIRVMAQET